jgi:hypothetical protein
MHVCRRRAFPTGTQALFDLSTGTQTMFDLSTGTQTMFDLSTGTQTMFDLSTREGSSPANMHLCNHCCVCILWVFVFVM